MPRSLPAAFAFPREIPPKAWMSLKHSRCARRKVVFHIVHVLLFGANLSQSSDALMQSCEPYTLAFAMMRSCLLDIGRSALANLRRAFSSMMMYSGMPSQFA